jgi:hypothetical protein
MDKSKTLYVVHCVDTEGPLHETLDATFARVDSLFGIKLAATNENLLKLQNKEINLNGDELAVAKFISPELLKYNKNWLEIEEMLHRILPESFRKKFTDDSGGGWVYSWHCMDHLGFDDNPRQKDFGYGNIFRFYRNKLKDLGNKRDELNWHFHPLSITRNPTHAATSYINNFDILVKIICRRILDDNWFPVVNRPGFHSERPDSNTFLEQWIPFDYANQADDNFQDQPDASFGRFGDWSRAPKSWRGYHPNHDDYQEEGLCRRVIFRCLNVGTRLRSLTIDHVREAFAEANESGKAILSFANHDWRDMQPDIEQVQNFLQIVKKEFPDVAIRYAGAEEAAIALLGFEDRPAPELTIELSGNRVFVRVLKGEIFGPQPFLAIRTILGTAYHDNFDVIIPQKEWTYVFDEQTINLDSVSKIAAGTAGRYGKYSVVSIDL